MFITIPAKVEVELVVKIKTTVTRPHNEPLDIGMSKSVEETIARVVEAALGANLSYPEFLSATSKHVENTDMPFRNSWTYETAAQHDHPDADR